MQGCLCFIYRGFGLQDLCCSSKSNDNRKKYREKHHCMQAEIFSLLSSVRNATERQMVKCLVGKNHWNNKEIGRLVRQKQNQRMAVSCILEMHSIVNVGLGKITFYIFRKYSETYFKVGEKGAINVVNLGMIHMEAVVCNMGIALNSIWKLWQRRKPRFCEWAA